MEKKLCHKHVLIKATIQKPPMEQDVLNTWFRELVEEIGMKICIEPRSNYVDVVGNRGITGIVGIETSHCSMHVWDEPNPSFLQMDVYSCSEFSPETILKKLNDFEIIDYELMYIDREDGFKVLKHDKGTL